MKMVKEAKKPYESPRFRIIIPGLVQTTTTSISSSSKKIQLLKTK